MRSMSLSYSVFSSDLIPPRTIIAKSSTAFRKPGTYINPQIAAMAAKIPTIHTIAHSSYEIWRRTPASSSVAGVDAGSVSGSEQFRCCCPCDSTGLGENSFCTPHHVRLYRFGTPVTFIPSQSSRWCQRSKQLRQQQKDRISLLVSP